MKKLHSLSLIKATLTIRRAKPTAAYLMVTILHFVVVLVVVLFDREQYAQGPYNSFVSLASSDALELEFTEPSRAGHLRQTS